VTGTVAATLAPSPPRVPSAALPPWPPEAVIVTAQIVSGTVVVKGPVSPRGTDENKVTGVVLRPCPATVSTSPVVTVPLVVG
jgi:hypothetical protein